jgi:hypothetical protein
MRKSENKRTFYFRTSEKLGAHIERKATEWGLTMNGYLNRLVREDFELELRKNTSFIEKVNRQISG